MTLVSSRTAILTFEGASSNSALFDNPVKRKAWARSTALWCDKSKLSPLHRR